MKKLFSSGLIIFCLLISYSKAQFIVAWDELTIDMENNCYPAQVGIVTDQQENVYTCWSSRDTVGSTDNVILLTKYSKNGTFIWTKKYHTQQPYSYYGYGPFDARIAGNTIFIGGGVNHDAFVCAIDTAGNYLWERVLGVNCNGTNDIRCIETTSDSGVIISGNRLFDQCTYEYEFIRKYDNAGNLVWSDFIDSVSYVGGLYIDSSGNIYSAASRLNAVNLNSRDIVITKYDPLGSKIFEVTFNSDSLGANLDLVSSIKESPDHSIWITGCGLRSTGSNDLWFTARMDASGNLLHRTTSSGINSSIGYSIAFDTGGNCYVTGTEDPYGTGSYITTIKYDTTCQQVWKKYFGPAGCQYAGGVENWTDNQGNVFVAGFWDNSTSRNFEIIQYDQASSNLIYNHSVIANLIFLTLDISTHTSPNANSVYYALMIVDNNGFPYINTAKLEKILSTSTGELNSGQIEIFPNPFHGNELTIQSSSPIERVSVYDLGGKLLYAKNISGNSIQLHNLNLSGGIYFLEAEYGNTVKRMKLIVE